MAYSPPLRASAHRVDNTWDGTGGSDSGHGDDDDDDRGHEQHPQPPPRATAHGVETGSNGDGERAKMPGRQ